MLREFQALENPNDLPARSAAPSAICPGQSDPGRGTIDNDGSILPIILPHAERKESAWIDQSQRCSPPINGLGPHANAS